MANRYVKAYFDWIEQTAALSDAEKGRLFIAILEYARSGQILDIGGRESILFPAFKAAIDRDAEISAINSSNGAKGGRGNKAKKANESDLKRTKANESDLKPTKTEDIRQKTEDIRHKTKTEYSTSVALNDAILSFIEFRKKSGKPMTDKAVDLMLKKLNGFSDSEEEQIEILNQSILNGWTGIYELKKGGDGRGNVGNNGVAGKETSKQWNLHYDV